MKEKPSRSRANRLPHRLVCLGALLIGLVSLSSSAYEQWSGPTPGWAAPAFSFIGFLVFCEWVASGAPSTPGPHDLDLGRYEMSACAAGFLANVLLVAGLVLGVLGAQRLARIFGRAAVCLGLASILLMKLGVETFELKIGGYLWVAAFAVLAFSRLNSPNDPVAAPNWVDTPRCP
jgi:hypothetical protein